MMLNHQMMSQQTQQNLLLLQQQQHRFTPDSHPMSRTQPLYSKIGNTLPQNQGTRQGMQQIFMEAKQKIKQLKDESSKYGSLNRNKSPRSIIEQNRQYVSRNNAATSYQTSVPFKYEKNEEYRGLYSTLVEDANRIKHYFRPQQSPVTIKTEKSTTRQTALAEASQRRKAKICNLKTQLQTMLVNTAPISPHNFKYTPQEKKVIEVVTPEKKSPFKLLEFVSGEKEPARTQRLPQFAGGGPQQNSSQKHSALKSRPVQQIPTVKNDKITVFQLALEDANQNPNQPIIVPLINESRFSIYTYSDTDEASILHDKPNPTNLINKIDLIDGGEPSITFISSKFIKSNSIESMPELNPENKQSVIVKKESSELQRINNQEDYMAGQSIESSSLFQCITNNHHNKKKRNKSEKVIDFEDCGSCSSKTVQKPSVQCNGAIIIQNPPSPIHKKQRNKKQPKLNEIVMKDEIQKMQAALGQVSEDQIKRLPVSYVQEMRRLARTINRVFGEHQSQ